MEAEAEAEAEVTVFQARRRVKQQTPYFTSFFLFPCPEGGGKEREERRKFLEIEPTRARQKNGDQKVVLNAKK